MQLLSGLAIYLLFGWLKIDKVGNCNHKLVSSKCHEWRHIHVNEQTDRKRSPKALFDIDFSKEMNPAILDNPDLSITSTEIKDNNQIPKSSTQTDSKYKSQKSTFEVKTFFLWKEFLVYF